MRDRQSRILADSMMHDSRPWVVAGRELARGQMEYVKNLHLVHLAIVSTRDRLHVFEFRNIDDAWMLGQAIPELVTKSGALNAIVSSPACSDVRDGLHVVLMEQAIEAFYVPVVRSSNCDRLIGDFRPTRAVDCNRYGPIVEALFANWVRRVR